MTFKNIVKGYVANDSKRWVEALLEENYITYDYIDSEDVEFMDNDKYGMTYECTVKISRRHGWEHNTLVVGGAVDQYDIYHSCIHENGKLIWMNQEESRKITNIEAFELA